MRRERSGSAEVRWQDCILCFAKWNGVAYHGLLHANGVCRSVDPPTSPHGYMNSTLTGINNAGLIVGVSFSAAAGDGDGFLLTPASLENGSAAVESAYPVRCAAFSGG